MAEVKTRMQILANPQMGLDCRLEAVCHYTSVNV